MPAGQHNEDRLQVSDLRFWGARFIVGIGRPSDQVVGHQRGEKSAAAMMAA